jgi:hypothetical protein
MDAALDEFHIHLITLVMNMCLIISLMSVHDDSFGEVSARIILSVV